MDFWQRLGMESETTVYSTQQSTDRERQSNFPALHVLRPANGRRRVTAYHSREVRVPETDFVGNNNSRYVNPAMDALFDGTLTPMPRHERMQIATQDLRHLTEQLPVIGLFYDGLASLQHQRLRDVRPLSGIEESRQAWNSHEWDLQ